MRRLPAAWSALALLAASCGNVEARAGTTHPSSPRPTAETTGIEWHVCGERLECGSVAVPLDHHAPGDRTITLALARIPAASADHRIGSLLVYAGGPGASGIDFVSFGEPFEPAVHDHFDVIGFDPRGVGDSTSLSCGDDLVQRLAQLDPDPDDDRERVALEDAARAVADECAAEDGDLLGHLGAVDVAYDIDAIRSALGEETISYVGVSYGTLVGQHYAEAFGSRTRAMVLDALIDPAEDFRSALRTETAAFDAAIGQLFGKCSSPLTRCPPSGAQAAYDRIQARVEIDPLPAGHNLLGPGDLADAALYVSYSPMLAPSFYRALEDGLAGDGSALRDLADSYRSSGAFAAYLAVKCVDAPHPVGAADYAAFSAELSMISPRFGASIANELLPCAFWPVAAATEPVPVDAPDAGPILVVGNTGDVASPFERTRRVSSTLQRGVLLIYDGEGHTSFGSSQCVNQRVTGFLVELRVPEPGTVCD